jgi:hypothetical protein
MDAMLDLIKRNEIKPIWHWLLMCGPVKVHKGCSGPGCSCVKKVMDKSRKEH